MFILNIKLSVTMKMNDLNSIKVIIQTNAIVKFIVKIQMIKLSVTMK